MAWREACYLAPEQEASCRVSHQLAEELLLVGHRSEDRQEAGCWEQGRLEEEAVEVLELIREARPRR